MTPPRHQTSTQRDLEGIEAKRRREAEHQIEDEDSGGVPVAIDFEEATGIVEGKELWNRRHKRSTEERLDHADRWRDRLTTELLASRRFNRVFMLRVIGVIGFIASVVGSYLLGRHG